MCVFKWPKRPIFSFITIHFIEIKHFLAKTFGWCADILTFNSEWVDHSINNLTWLNWLLHCTQWFMISLWTLLQYWQTKAWMAFSCALWLLVSLWHWRHGNMRSGQHWTWKKFKKMFTSRRLIPSAQCCQMADSPCCQAFAPKSPLLSPSFFVREFRFLRWKNRWNFLWILFSKVLD